MIPLPTFKSHLYFFPFRQSRACQKLHWSSHKLICESQYLILLTLKWLGPEIETAFNSFAKFSKNISGHLEKPAISALELWRDKGRVGEFFFRITTPFFILYPFFVHESLYLFSSLIDNHVFLLRVRGKKTIFPNGVTRNGYRGCYTYKILSAEAKSMQAMHALLDYRSGPYSTPDVTERALAHRPGLLRIFVMDTSGDIPPPLDGYTLPTDISNWPKNYHQQYDRDWLKHFLEDIGQPVVEPRPGPFGEGDFVGRDGQDGDGDGDEVNPALYVPLLVPPARPSSPVDRFEEKKED